MLLCSAFPMLTFAFPFSFSYVFFILVEGSAKATLDSDPSNSVMKYKSGDYFGELALLRGEPRAANVITEE